MSYPQPTTVPTRENILAAADCVELLVRLIRGTWPGFDDVLSEEDVARFQEMNWNALIDSMRAWPDHIEGVISELEQAMEDHGP